VSRSSLGYSTPISLNDNTISLNIATAQNAKNTESAISRQMALKTQ
jgi:hypothetical protein